MDEIIKMLDQADEAIRKEVRRIQGEYAAKPQIAQAACTNLKESRTHIQSAISILMSIRPDLMGRKQ